MKITASKLDLLAKCAGATSLPWTDDREQWADAGQDNHAEYERRIDRGDVPDVLREHFPLVTAWHSEIKVAINLRTNSARILGKGSDRAYDVSEDELPGTCDVYGSHERTLYVVDWKLKNFVDPADNWQLRFYALALAHVHGFEHVVLAIFPEVGRPKFAELDFFALEAFELDLRKLVADAALKLPIYNSGPHCRRCPGFHACPTTQALKAEVVRRADLIGPVMSIETDEDAARAYGFYEQLQILSKRFGALLYARASERPIPLADGRVFGPHLVEGREKLDGDIAYQVVRELHGQGIADAAVQRTATKSGIKQALDFAGVSNKAAAEREILAKVRERGGSKKEQSERVEAYMPSKQLKESA